MASVLKEHLKNRRNMLGKFILVTLGLTAALVVVLHSASVSSSRDLDSVDCQIEKKENNAPLKIINQLVATINDALSKNPAKNADNVGIANNLRRKRDQNQELKNAILERGRKEFELEQEKKNLEQKLVQLDNNCRETTMKKEILEAKVATLLTNFTNCQNHEQDREILLQKTTQKLQSCETERDTEKRSAFQSTKKIEEVMEKNQALNNAIFERAKKESELEHQNFEQKMLNIIDKKVETLISNFTKCYRNQEVLSDRETQKLQSCVAERETTEKRFAAYECILNDSQNRRMLGVEKENCLLEKSTLIANLDLCEVKRKMFGNYVLESFLKNSPYAGVDKYTRYTVARLGMLPIKNVKPLIPEFGPVINDVLSFRYPINIPSCPAAAEKSNKITTLSDPSVFIALISATDHFKKRNDIRETWLVHLKSAMEKNLLGMARFGFFLGQTKDDSIQKRIEEESRKHGDIVQIAMDDSYRNLTLKGIAVLNWVRQHCANADLVFKVDDDIYVNVHNLVHFVRSNYQSNNSLFGYGFSGWTPYPIRMELGYQADYAKWDMTFEEYPWSHYPNYIIGPAYFMHASVVIPLLAVSQTTALLPFEDVFLTGMCTEKAGVKMRYSTGTHSVFYRSVPAVPTPCDLRKFVGWETNNQFVAHSAVDDFYRNKTQCVVTGSDGTNKTIDFTAPVVFKFT